MCSKNVTLLVPGYLDPRPELYWYTGYTQDPWQLQLNRLLDQRSDALGLPAARLSNPDIDSAESIICAEPVHLQADRDTATLLPGAVLGLSGSEADRMLASCNEFLAEDSLHLFRDSASSWYLTGMDGSNLASLPPSFLAQRNASAYMPEGEGSGQWRRLMTELQMLLHTHPVNEERQQQGKVPVNSVWFWGGAAMPDKQSVPGTAASTIKASVSYPELYADEPYAVRLAEALACECHSLEAFRPGELKQTMDRDLVIVDTRIAQALFVNDESMLQDARENIDSHWLSTLRHALKSGQVGSVTLINEDGAQGSLTAEPHVIQKTWRRFYGAIKRG